MNLVQRLQQKEEKALVQLMELHGDYLLRTAFLLVKDRQVAEEIVQDSFIVAFDKIDQLQHEERLRNWLTMISLNLCRSRMRKWSWKHILVGFEDKFENLEDDEIVNGPEDMLMTLSQNTELYIAIQQLDYKYREVITLHYFNELKVNEISDQLNEKDSTIKTRLSRGRKLLKEILLKGGLKHAE
ncbi:RNA polymerase sigma-70 factor (ECF subfamily) [Bacillus mesophilus]|uniref:Sigma-70 family RNA polymerase sigma factor n=1 Tax=Bacillus mesophilus TaxID=1808955 RepID=A0A6M0QB56_9BACI|nr:RNA polymerase sigma-70 factor (ECF subfamily) [Bacillus mesophilus]NEY73487.1 sigma-70 family RNA polymerase sigma factor [Bacillus mesophilus]